MRGRLLELMIRFECAVAATRGSRDYQEDSAAFWPGGDDPFAVPVAAGCAGKQWALLCLPTEWVVIPVARLPAGSSASIFFTAVGATQSGG